MNAFEWLVQIWLLGSSDQGLMLFLSANFDDAGTHDDSKVVVWGGFIAPAAQWISFDKAWRTKLEAPLPGKPRLTKFSLGDCQQRRNEFIGYSDAERDLLQNEMREIIVQHKLLGMSYAVDRPAWDRLVAGQARNKLGDAETVCFGRCFEAAIERAEKYFPRAEMLSLRFDFGRKTPKLDKIVSHIEGYYRGKPTLANISFESVSEVTPLQAADIIATETYWHALGCLNGNPQVRPHFAHFLERVSTEGFILDEALIREMLKNHGFSAPAGQPS